MDIKSLINKVVASKGILRVPSWWMKKLLTEIVEYINSGDSANSENIVKVKEDTNNKITTLESKIKSTLIDLKRSLHTQKCFIVETGNSSGYVIVDDTRQDIPANTKKVITYIGSFKFSDGSNNAIIFIGLNVSDTSSITDMNRMFDSCYALTSLDFSGFDTSAVTGMNGMFSSCSALTSLDLSGFDTSKVTDMKYMFYSCSALTSLDLSGFDTSAVTGMNGMFTSCSALTSLDLSSFDTSAVTDMNRMFNRCSKLTSLDLSSFDTSAVTNTDYMFTFCSALTSLNLGSNFFKTSIVKGIGFYDCSKWTNGTVITSLVTNSYNRKAAGLKTLILGLHANTKAVLSDEQKAAITSKGYTIA